MKTFLLVMLLLNAKTGEQIEHRFESGPDGKMMTREECATALGAKGVTRPQDDTLVAYVCFNTTPESIET